MTTATLMRRFLAGLVAWIAFTTALNALMPGSPEDLGFLLVVLTTLVAPPIAFLVAYRRSPRVRAVALSLDHGAITAVQVARTAGIAMLALWAVDRLAAPFALWTGLLDVLIGLSAVFVAYLATQRRPLPRRALARWHVLGLADFVIALPIALLWSATSLGAFAGPGDPAVTEMFELPLSFIPMVGVPFTATMHLVALLQLRDAPQLRVAPLLPTG